MGIVAETLDEIRAAQVIAAGICPIMARMVSHRFEADTAFCAWCPDGESIPASCEQRCRLYEPEREWGLTGGCKMATAANPHYRCICFSAKGAEWHAAHDAWRARQRRALERDARIERGRRESARLRMGRVRMEVTE